MKKAEIKLFKKQIECFTFLEDRHTTEVLFGGGAGGSKTFTGCLWQILRRLKYPNTRSVIGRAKLKTLKQTTLNTFFEVANDYLGLRRGFDYFHNNNSSEITFANGSLIYLKDLFYYPSDPQYTALGGLEITDCFIDEAAEVSEIAINILNSRIRYKLDEYNLIPKTLLTCNPSKGWLYTQYYKPSLTDDLPKHKKFVKSLVTDNKAVSKHYIAQLGKLDKISRERLLYGNWEYSDDDALLFDYDSIQDAFTNSHAEKGQKFISVDVARFGDDKTAIILWDGLIVEKIISIDKSSMQQVATEIQSLANSNEVPRSRIIIDEDGVGGGVIDIMSGVKGFVANSRAIKGENYQNLKVQCMYKLAELVNTGKIYIKDKRYKEQIIEELEIVKRTNVDKDSVKLSIEGKEIVKQKLGRSPDYSDAIMMRMWFEVFGNYGDYAII